MSENQAKMRKDRTESTNKLHFLLNHNNKLFRVRAACLILRDFDGNCLMTLERRLSKQGRNVVGFCGGTVEEMDDCILDTMMREVYEECILSDELPPTWKTDWHPLYERIKLNPTNLDETILNYIYTICSTKSMVYLDGHNPVLKCMYFQVNLPKLYSNYLVNKYDMQVISPIVFDLMNEIRSSRKMRYCIDYKIPSYTVNDINFRLREIMIATKEFCKFLQYGLSKIDSDTKYNSVLEIAQHSPWYPMCHAGQARVESCKDADPVCRDSCILMNILLDRQDMQQIYDYWYAQNLVDHGMSVLCLTHHMMHGSFLPKELEKSKAALLSSYS
jgi:hypothetical protein